MRKMKIAKFEILETRQLSKELDRDWEQELVVSRAGEAFLRLAGDGSDYRVMTATAGENGLGLEACKHPEILLQAAHDLAVRKVDGFDGIERDRKGRNYVQLFLFSQDEGVSDEDFTNELRELLEEFFAIYDGLRGLN
jgi:hypothetical protein